MFKTLKRFISNNVFERVYGPTKMFSQQKMANMGLRVIRKDGLTRFKGLFDPLGHGEECGHGSLWMPAMHVCPYMIY